MQDINFGTETHNDAYAIILYLEGATIAYLYKGSSCLYIGLIIELIFSIS